MDQPAPGHPVRARDAVISAPHHVPPLRKGLFAGLTLVAWSAFAWLVAPVLTLVLWLLGLATAYGETARWLGHVDGSLLAGIASTSFPLALALLAWAATERRRFAGADRRNRPVDASAGDVAAALGVAREVAGVMRSGKVVVLHLDACGPPVRALVSLVGVPGSADVTVPQQRGPVETSPGRPPAATVHARALHPVRTSAEPPRR